MPRQSGHIPRQSGHISLESGHMRPKTGHIGPTEWTHPKARPHHPTGDLKMNPLHAPLALRNHSVYTRPAAYLPFSGVPMPALGFHHPSGCAHLASLVERSPSRPRLPTAISVLHAAPDLQDLPIRQKIRQNCLSPARPLRGRAGERQFPLSSPRMIRVPDSHNALR